MIEYFEFLMDELSSVYEEFDDDNDRAHAVMVTLSAFGNIPETYYRLYIAPLQIDKDRLHNCLAYFVGIGEIDIECDCSPEDKFLCDINEIYRTEFYKFGKESIFNTREWYKCHNEVLAMKSDLWGNNGK
jgi:hypothetical protein